MLRLLFDIGLFRTLRVTHTGMKRQQKFINTNNNKANIYSLYCSIYTTQTHGSFVCPSFHPSIISFAMVIR